jgi:hypothetical protein
MRTFEIRTKRSENKKPVEKIEIDTGNTLFRITLDIDGGLRINKVDKTEDWKHSISISPASGNEIIVK